MHNHNKIRNKKDLLRNFILDRSETLFIANGYQKTSMDMIAAECGLSKPTLYNYFKSKYELFTILYARIYQNLFETAKQLLGQDKDKWRILEEIIDEYFNLVNTKIKFLIMYFREQHLVIHENIDEHMEWHVRSKKEMVELLSVFLKDIIRPDVKKKFGVKIVASTIFNLFEGIIGDLILRGEEEVAGQKKFLIQLLRNGVLSGCD